MILPAHTFVASAVPFARTGATVRWAKFAPLGCRGFDGGNPDGLYTAVPIAEYIAHANRETLVCIQLEEQHAIDLAEAIAAVPGVDVLMLGPADFSILSGIPGDFGHPMILNAMTKIAAAARKTGKHWARPASNLEQARLALELGARMIFHISDLVIVKNGMERMQEQFAPLGFSFVNRLANAPISSNSPVLSRESAFA